MSVFWWIATKDNEQYVVVKLYKQAVSEEVPSVTMSFLMHALELKLQFCWIINLFYHVPRKYIKLGGVGGEGQSGVGCFICSMKNSPCIPQWLKLSNWILPPNYSHLT